jgi:hypothetical protein
MARRNRFLVQRASAAVTGTDIYVNGAYGASCPKAYFIASS